jgi:hypothetical protein
MLLNASDRPNWLVLQCAERKVTLPRRSNKEETRIQTDAKLKRKEAQARAGAKAMADYEAASRAIIEKLPKHEARRRRLLR